MVAATLRVVGCFAQWAGDVIGHGLNSVADLLSLEVNTDPRCSTVVLPVRTSLEELRTNRLVVDGQGLYVLRTVDGVLISQGSYIETPEGDERVVH